MKLATWNVNSLKVRLPHVLDWLAAQQPDVLCLQETKLEDRVFPAAELAAAGYQSVCHGQKTYNGVAILSRQPLHDVRRAIDGLDDPQARLIAATVGGLRVVCGYFPNGQAVGSDKYAYKLRWLAALREQLEGELAATPELVLLGDFNIAPEDRDVHDPAAWRDQILCSDAERAAFADLIGLGLKDAFRLFEQAERTFSWWDYRMMAHQRNMGLRIDHILVGEVLAGRCRACSIDRAPRRLERPSDHAPVVVEID